MKLLDIVDPNYPKIRKDERIKHVLDTLYKLRVDRVIVLKNSGDLYGIATEWDIFFKLSMIKREKYQPYNLPLSSVSTYPVDTLIPSADLKTAINMFMIKGYSSIPLVDDDNTIYGLLTKKDIIKTYLPYIERLRLKAENIMREVKGKVEPFNSLKNVENKMRLGEYNTLIVHSNGKYLGVITALDLAKTLFQIRKLHPTREWNRYIERLSVIDILKKDIKTLGRDSHIYEASELLAEGRQKIVPIIDEDDKVVGLITRRHILKIILDKIL